MVEAASIILYIHRKIIKKLQKANATAENPKTAEEAGITTNELQWIDGLIFQGKVKEIVDEEGNKRYYAVQ
ncbi:MAG: hypothetical protein ACPLW8_05135 [Candidatus Bathyarchaeales archaeon]